VSDPPGIARFRCSVLYAFVPQTRTKDGQPVFGILAEIEQSGNTSMEREGPAHRTLCNFLGSRGSNLHGGSSIRIVMGG